MIFAHSRNKVVPPNYGGGGTVVTPPTQEEMAILIDGPSFQRVITDPDSPVDRTTSIVFTDEVAPEGADKIDMSDERNWGIVGWVDGDTFKVSTQKAGKKVIFNPDSSKMFFKDADVLPTIKSIDLSNADTSLIENMNLMFDNCVDLKALD